MFVKGIPADCVLADKYRAEASTARQLPEATPAPRLRWNSEIADWVVLAFEDIEGWHAQLTPGSPDIEPVVATIAGLAEALTPCPVPEVPPATVELVHGWGELATAPPADLDSWTRHHLNDLAARETQWLPAAEGKTLLHGDINQANLLVDSSGAVVVIDWAQPVCGAAWIDIADLVPHLILGGHTPAAAEAALADVRTWRDTDPTVITSYAAAFAGYWARNSRRPPHLACPLARPPSPSGGGCRHLSSTSCQLVDGAPSRASSATTRSGSV